MKKTLMNVIAFGFVLAIVVIASSPAEALCLPAKLFGTWGEGYFYVNFGATANTDTAAVVGRFWEPGQRGAKNEGTYDDSNWFLDYAGKKYTSGNLGDARTTGCPAGQLLTVLQAPTTDGGAEFVAMQVSEIPANAVAFDYSRRASDFNAAPIPRPNVSLSSRSGPSVNLTLSIADAAGGFYGVDSQTIARTYNLVRFTGTADPGRSAAAWTLAQAVPANTPTAITADCSNTATDVFYATQLVIDGVASDLVSKSVRVECDPTLADPDKQFKLIEGPGEKPRPVRQR